LCAQEGTKNRTDKNLSHVPPYAGIIRFRWWGSEIRADIQSQQSLPWQWYKILVTVHSLW